MRIKLFTDKGIVEVYDSDVIPNEGNLIVFKHRRATYCVNKIVGNKEIKHIIHSHGNLTMQMEIEISVKQIPHTVSVKETVDIKEV